MFYNESIDARLKAGTGCWSEDIPGWREIIIELDEKLSILCPEYRIDQIKEKFGSLRFYASGVSDEGDQLIFEAENETEITCINCGNPSKITNHGWCVNTCGECKRSSGRDGSIASV